MFKEKILIHYLLDLHLHKANENVTTVQRTDVLIIRMSIGVAKT